MKVKAVILFLLSVERSLMVDPTGMSKQTGKKQGWEQRVCLSLFLISQLRIIRTGDFCLTQKGSKAGSADMALQVR